MLELNIFDKYLNPRLTTLSKTSRQTYQKSKLNEGKRQQERRQKKETANDAEITVPAYFNKRANKIES